jgi:hypothetical protein
VSILILACVEVPIRREEFLQSQQRLEGNSWLLFQTQRRALRSIEHPGGDAKTVAPIILRKMTAQNGLAYTSKLTANNNLSPEQWVPPILYAAARGFLVSVSPASKSMALAIRNAAQLGYRVLRLDAELVRNDLEQAVAQIRCALGEPS